MSFFGFVALADMIFAVSAGLLLINPLQMDDLADGDDPSIPDLPALTRQMDEIERSIAHAEMLAEKASGFQASASNDPKQ